MLTFAAEVPDEKRKMSPMALFHGPPGTGKTSLCQAMAQRLSVRLSKIYPNTTMIQIKTATLLSKYYSESAKQVDELFTKIKIMCESDTKRIIFVLIDEVESIAGSRHKGIADGESQDSLRATNALITGFDRVKRCPNIVFLCTSNMVEYLDRAFVDRCSVQVEFTQPSKECQYKILRTCILSLIARKIIAVDDKNDGNARGTRIENYNFARLLEAGTSSPSDKLYKIVESLHSEDAKERFGNTISGRFLSQLPMQVLMKYTRPKKSIQLDHALDLIGRELGEMSKRNHKRKWELDTKQAETSGHSCCTKELIERLVESKLLPPSPPTPVKKIFHGYPKGGYSFSSVRCAAYDFATDYDDPNHTENNTHRDKKMAQRTELMTSRCSSEQNRQESAYLEFDDENFEMAQVQNED
ncbi:pachytene checkpoint component pch2 protein [Rutstroemia sp. NJR-2017a BVV2]|nr:pachytene checkpoint component pch2 protein [Rutstroemia sp. NJR-2017a BVV2]PQE18424.1 pachytene checkpoint component pch2 protein [Rutstroemia sp. NJR-2017a BVV2]